MLRKLRGLFLSFLRKPKNLFFMIIRSRAQQLMFVAPGEISSIFLMSQRQVCFWLPLLGGWLLSMGIGVSHRRAAEQMFWKLWVFPLIYHPRKSVRVLKNRVWDFFSHPSIIRPSRPSFQSGKCLLRRAVKQSLIL